VQHEHHTRGLLGHGDVDEAGMQFHERAVTTRYGWDPVVDWLSGQF
jgi:hypothetical protein